MLRPNLFKKLSNPIITKRRSDILAVVAADVSNMTLSAVNALAASQPDVPTYKPDGAGATLVFHTNTGDYVLGGVRENPALSKETTKDATQYPLQINSTIGGYAGNPEAVLRDAVLDSIKNKMFLKVALSEDQPGYQDQQILMQLCDVIANDDGWESRICVHTDKWVNDDKSEGTMCYMTTIKHINCNDADLVNINEALQATMAIKKAEGVNTRALSEFKFVELQPIIENSLASYLDDEKTKAIKAYERFGDVVAVTFNDLAIATLAKNSAFKFDHAAQLSMTNNSFRK
jgi:hypothetical protein